MDKLRRMAMASQLRGAMQRIHLESTYGLQSDHLEAIAMIQRVADALDPPPRPKAAPKPCCPCEGKDVPNFTQRVYRNKAGDIVNHGICGCNCHKSERVEKR